MLGETVGTISVSGSGYLITRVNNINGITVTEYPETVITHIHLISGTASVLNIANGQGGTNYIKFTGTANTGSDVDFGIFGITFPKGAYVTVDGNIVTAQITCKANKM